MSNEPTNDSNTESPYQSAPPVSAPTATAAVGDDSFPRSTAMQQSPQLSSTALTRLLIGMCLIPTITIFALWAYMPPAKEGELKCQFAAKDLPGQEFYAIEYWKRDEYKLGELLVSNLEEHDWTHLNMQVNGHYQIYDKEPIPAGTTKVYKLERFISRAGARFNLQYNQLKSARIYARRDNPKHDRATYSCDFKEGKPVEVER